MKESHFLVEFSDQFAFTAFTACASIYHELLSRRKVQLQYQQLTAGTMASTQEKTEKDRFFHDLYLLDSLDDELPDSEVDLPNKPIKKPSRQPLTALVASQDERRKPVTHKSKSSEHGRELAPRSAQAADSGSTRLKAPLWVLTKEMALSGKRKITTAAEPESRTRLSETAARQGDTELRIERVRASLAVDLDAQHRKGEKPAETRRHVTDLSNIKQRKRQLGSKKLPPVPVDQQMFRGLLLCTCCYHSP